MDGLHIYIGVEKITVTNERVHLSFDRHFLDDPEHDAHTRCLRGTDIQRLFEAINALNDLSAPPPGNTHLGAYLPMSSASNPTRERLSGESHALAEMVDVDNAETEGSAAAAASKSGGRRRQ